MPKSGTSKEPSSSILPPSSRSTLYTTDMVSYCRIVAAALGKLVYVVFMSISALYRLDEGWMGWP
jgi:hypothetical protein